MDHARDNGLEVIDLQQFPHITRNSRVDCPTDSHWNSLDHEICFDAIWFNLAEMVFVH